MYSPFDVYIKEKEPWMLKKAPFQGRIFIFMQQQTLNNKVYVTR